MKKKKLLQVIIFPDSGTQKNKNNMLGGEYFYVCMTFGKP